MAEKMTAAFKDRPDFIPKIEYIKIDLLEPNEGQYSQIDEVTNKQIGLGHNPRWIRDKRYEALKKSITDDPEYLLYNPLEIFTLSHIKGKDGKYIVVGGNQRLQACKDLGFEEVPCVVFLPDTPFQKLRAYAIKSNEAYGQNDYDVLANGEWNTEELEEWGMELDYIAPGEGDQWDEINDPDAGGKKDGGEDESMYSRKIQPPVYEITGAEPTIAECIDMTPVKKLLAEIDASGVSEEQKEMLRACAYRHAVIHFDQMAEYYAHQKAEMQDLMENNALVIIDYDKALERGFVEMTSRLQHLIPDAEEGATLDESEIEVVDADRYENDETYSDEE